MLKKIYLKIQYTPTWLHGGLIYQRYFQLLSHAKRHLYANIVSITQISSLHKYSPSSSQTLSLPLFTVSHTASVLHQPMIPPSPSRPT